MAFDHAAVAHVTTIIELITMLIALCFAKLPTWWINSTLRLLLSDEPVLQELLDSAGLVFAPSLLEAVQFTAPPTLDWFKSLPTRAHKRWGVYVIVLEKQGSRPRIYVGSGTGADKGVSNRIANYDNRTTFPHYVEKAFNEGFNVTNKGLLLWAPIPRPGSVPKLRLLFLKMECAFAFVFWSMRRTPKMLEQAPELCPWPLDALQYDGVCSHAAMSEKGIGDIGLSEAQLEAIAVEAKERKAAAYKAYRQTAERKAKVASEITEAKAIAAKLTAQEPVKAPKGTPHYRARKRKTQAENAKRNPDQAKASMNAANNTYKAKALREKKYHDPICDKAFPTKQKLARHMISDIHTEE
ncbi:hypothetical protein CLAFUW4_13003 [Fulvia fulva]|uniref:C2H2-type domain-containing protein n=1 Tax=Passalora fulva TaxID=5499 RepID=A0A9Q8PJ29_PASFU|nr:uncharacterized protein CLAFUR5_12865 [Fulvia fulva]KAK4612135.1 hypothetical protein CLAFUR4_13007 [Fulvia fulva]UJO23347.1 hypothetical protein CLAFUR5_12865 [Fulvia fulva]WPV21130.1 hypothetical protein CLAFUW4_13003 [Fulvia fulva]WPV35940.1 hypothetical protein CLAFUW7_13010 [Fulvia fulva]